MPKKKKDIPQEKDPFFKALNELRKSLRRLSRRRL